MKFSNYDGKNTVNLISSIQKYCSINNKVYEELELIPSSELKKYDNVILFLIDGLGFKWLGKYGKESFLYSKMIGNIKSVFPSTTASAITTISTGFTPSEHSVIGWDIYEKEVGEIIQIFPWKNKITKASLGENINIENLITKENFYKNSLKDVFVITDNKIKDSKYNCFYNQNAKVFGYDNLKDFFKQTLKAVDYSKKGKYIYSYWLQFDEVCHTFGIDSMEAKKHFEEIDYEFKKLEKELKNTNTLAIITADHGQINYEKHINLKEDFEEIYNMLKIPLTGGKRTQFCFVKDDFKDIFYKTVKEKLDKICFIYTKQEVIDMKMFGFGKDKKFLERIGDFILLEKDFYIMTDGIDKIDIGNHSGISDWEILVPVIKF